MTIDTNILAFQVIYIDIRDNNRRDGQHKYCKNKKVIGSRNKLNVHARHSFGLKNLIRSIPDSVSAFSDTVIGNIVAPNTGINATLKFTLCLYEALNVKEISIHNLNKFVSVSLYWASATRLYIKECMMASPQYTLK